MIYDLLRPASIIGEINLTNSDVGRLCLIMFAHWFADFVCQTDKQAKEKSKNEVVLAQHCAIYSTVVFSILAGMKVNYVLWMALFATHFVTDFVTSRITRYYFDNNEHHNAFVTIGFDQFIHFVVLMILYTK